MKQHVTKVHKGKSWFWTCTCGDSSTGYPTRETAVNASYLHRAMEELKGDK